MKTIARRGFWNQDELLPGRRHCDILRKYTPRYICIDDAEMAQPQWSDKLLADHTAAGCRVHNASVQSPFPDQHTCSGGAYATLLLMLLLLLLLPYCLLPLLQPVLDLVDRSLVAAKLKYRAARPGEGRGCEMVRKGSAPHNTIGKKR
jgi:hypothetical protein